MGSVNFVVPRDIRATLANCDVLMAVGAPLFQLIFPDPERGVLNPETKVVQLDSYTHEIGKNVRPDWALLGEAKAGVAELPELIAERQSAAVRAEAAERRKDAEARVAS